jgi:hypothetical protein
MHLIGTPSRNPLACSKVPQPTTLTRAPSYLVGCPDCTELWTCVTEDKAWCVIEWVFVHDEDEVEGVSGFTAHLMSQTAIRSPGNINTRCIGKFPD